MAKCKLNFDNKSVTTNNPLIQLIFKDLKGSGTDEIVSKLLDEFNIDMDTDSTSIKTYLKNYTELELKLINKILKNLESEIEKQNNQPAEDLNLLLPGLDTAEIEDYSAKELEEFLFANVSGVSEYQSIEIRDQLVNTILLGGKDKNSEVLVSQKNLLSRLSSLIYGSIDEPGWLDIIIDYLESEGIELTSDPDNIKDSLEEAKSKFIQKIIELKKSPESYKAIIESQLVNYITNGDASLLKALYAYYNIIQYETVIKNNLGDTIVLDKRIPNNNEEEDPLGLVTYKLDVDKQGRRINFNEKTDATVLTGRLSKLVIGTIPKVAFDPSSEFPRTFKLTLQDFQLALSSITMAAYSPSNGDTLADLRNILLDFNGEPDKFLDFIKSLFTKEEDGSYTSHIVFNKLNDNVDAFDIKDIMFSIYKYLEDTNYRILDSKKDTKIKGYTIVELLAGVATRTNPANYLQNLYSTSTGYTAKILESHKLGRADEIIQNILYTTDRTEMGVGRDSYTVSYEGGTWTIKSNDGKFTLTIYKKKSSGLVTMLFDNDTTDLNYFDIKINGDKFKDSNNLSRVNKSILKFIKEFTNIDLEAEDLAFQVYVNMINQISSKETKSYIKGMLITAAKSAIVRDLNIKYAEESYDKSFKDWITHIPNLPFRTFSKFRDIDGDLRISPVSSDTWIKPFSKALLSIHTKTTKSTIKNAENKNMGIYRGTYLAAHILKQAHQISKDIEELNDETIKSTLLFTTGNGRQLVSDKLYSVIGRTTFDTESKNFVGDTKMTKKMGLGELLYQSMFIHFYGSAYTNDTLFIQPTTCSDKVSIPKIEITKAKAWLNLSKEELIQKYADSIGGAYALARKSVLEDFKKVFSDVNNFTELAAKLKVFSQECLNKDLSPETELCKLFFQNGLTLQRDLHYRPAKDGTLYLNETLLYSEDLFNIDRLSRRFKVEEKCFLNMLIESQISLDVLFDGETSINTSTNPIAQAIKNSKIPNYRNEWVDSYNQLIYAKVIDPVTNKTLKTINKLSDLLDVHDDNELIVMNPLLEKFFYVEGLLSNNLRFILVKSEMNHPDKSRAFDILLKSLTTRLNNYIDKYLIKNASDLILHNIILSDPELREEFERFKQTVLINIELNILGSQYKRNTIITATVQDIIPTPGGMPNNLNIACIGDDRTEVTTFAGEVKSLEVNDGSARISPFLANLENISLLDLAVSKRFKKPIWHLVDTRTMTTGQMKFATFTINNEKMRHLGSNLSAYELFRKMHSMEFGIDLTKKTDSGKFGVNLEFERDILDGTNLFYEKEHRKEYRRITDFKNVKIGDKLVYYTKEYSYNNLCIAKNNKPIYVVHLYKGRDIVKLEFPKVGNDMEVAIAEKLNEGYHSILTLFELHDAMGGIYSVDFKYNDNGALIPVLSETSCDIVTNFITVIRRGGQAPLKDKMIHYAVNPSALKMMLANVNPTSSWFDLTPLMYFTAKASGIGSLLDAEHEVDETTKVSEFTQVIAALESYARMHKSVSGVYRALGRVALKSVELIIDPILKIVELKGVNKEVLKDELSITIGKLIHEHFIDRSGGSLGRAIIDEVSKSFGISKNSVELLKLKMPFSDENIYTRVIPAFISLINGKAIKRPYPGLNAVIVPSFGQMLIYPVNELEFVPEETKENVLNGLGLINEAYTYQDLCNAAELDKSVSDPTQLRINGVNKLLQTLQDKVKFSKSSKEFQLMDRVQVADDEGNVLDEFYLELVSDFIAFVNLDWWHFALKDLKAIKKFFDKQSSKEIRKLKAKYVDKDNVVDYTLNNENFVEFCKVADLTNAPSIVKIVAANELKFRQSILKPRDLAPQRISFEVIENGVPVRKNYFALKLVLNILKTGKPNYKLAQLILECIRAGYDPDSVENIENKNTWESGNKILKGSIKNLAAELVTPNIHSSKFNNTDYKSLVECKKMTSMTSLAGFKYTNKSNSDLRFSIANGHHIFININTPPDSTQTKQLKWRNVRDEKIDNDHKKLVIKDFRNQTILDIGRQERMPNLQWNKEKSLFVDNNGMEVPNLGLYSVDDKGDVWKTTIYVTKHEVNANRKFDRNIIYYINKDVLSEDEIAHIVNLLYNINNYTGFLVYGDVNFDTKTLTMPDNIYNIVKKANLYKDEPQKTFWEYIIKDKKLKITEGYRDEYLKLINHYNSLILNSFEMSRYYTSSRIPSQNLQSFMLMHTVAFTGSTSNEAYVSHYQTFIQGSDFDIDKAFLMSLEFDKLGRLIKWSDLFDYSTWRTLRASTKLPIPRGIKYTVSRDAKSIIRSEYSELYEKILNDPNISEETRTVRKLKLLSDLLLELDDSDGKVKFQKILSSNANTKLLEDLNKHSATKIPSDEFEKAFKNYISFNIMDTVLDLRNVITAYTPISMDRAEDARQKANAKRETSKTHISSYNSASKFKMQEENLVGKDTIAIFANGSKFYFNSLYYFMECIRTGHTDYIRFDKIFKRIAGRAVGNLKDFEVNTLAGLNELYLKNLGKTFDEVQDLILRGIEQHDNPSEILSELLSAATDNAKVLILHDINAGSNLAGMYITMIVLGFNLDDIVAFMTSDVGDLINRLSKGNFFANQESSVAQAVNIVKNGQFDLSKYTFYTKTGLEMDDDRIDYDTDERQGSVQKKKTNLKQNVVLSILRNEARGDYHLRCKRFIRDTLLDLNYNESFVYDLLTKSEDIDAYKTVKWLSLKSSKWEEFVNKLRDNTNDEEVVLGELTRYIYKNLKSIEKFNVPIPELKLISPEHRPHSHVRFIGDMNFILTKLYRGVQNSKGETWFEKYQNLMADIDEFSKIQSGASEITSVTSNFFNLNLGIPSSEVDITKRLMNIERSVQARELAFLINKKTSDIKKLAQKLKKFNPTLDEKHILYILRNALNLKFIGNFNAAEYINNTQTLLLYEVTDSGKLTNNPSELMTYVQFTIEYYNLIKDTYNIFDMMEMIPQYKAILRIFKGVLNIEDLLIAKSKAFKKVVKLLNKSSDIGKLEDKDYSNLLRFITGFYVYKFINREDFDFKFPKIKGTHTINAFEDFEKVSKTELGSIVTPQDCSAFKYYVEQVLVPLLQSGSYIDVDENGNKITKQIDVSDNFFIKLLICPTDRNGMPKLKVAFESTDTNTDKGIIELEAARRSFRNLLNYTLCGKPLTEFFILYNLLCNKNSYGNDTLTSIFDKMITSSDILSEFFEFIGNLDNSENDGIEDLDIKDFLKVNAKTIGTNAARFDRSTYKRTYSGILQRMYVSQTIEAPEEELIFRNMSELRSPNILTLKMKMKKRYRIFQLPSILKQIGVIDILNTTNLDTYKDLIKLMLELNTLFYAKDCA